MSVNSARDVASQADARAAASARRDAAARMLLQSAPATEASSRRPRSADDGRVLLEIMASTLNVDVDHAGETLVVLADRVELRDRNGQPIHAIARDNLSGVTIRKRLGHATVVVYDNDGGEITMRGVRPELARQLRAVTAETSPAPAGRPSPGSSTPTFGSGVTYVDALKLLDQVAAIGLLTPKELADKRALLARQGPRPS